MASGQTTSDVIRYTPHIVGDGPRVLADACALGAEGIVSKRLDAPYTAGRTNSWRKSKCAHAEPFVIGGFTVAGDAVGALLVGEFNTAGELCYAGSVGTGKGFTREFLVSYGPSSVASKWSVRRS